jgi:hypothetical protein
MSGHHVLYKLVSFIRELHVSNLNRVIANQAQGTPWISSVSSSECLKYDTALSTEIFSSHLTLHNTGQGNSAVKYCNPPPRKYPLITKGKQPNKHRGGILTYTETTERPTTTEVREIQLGNAWVRGRHVK